MSNLSQGLFRWFSRTASAAVGRKCQLAWIKLMFHIVSEYQAYWTMAT